MLANTLSSGRRVSSCPPPAPAVAPWEARKRYRTGETWSSTSLTVRGFGWLEISVKFTIMQRKRANMTEACEVGLTASCPTSPALPRLGQSPSHPHPTAQARGKLIVNVNSVLNLHLFYRLFIKGEGLKNNQQ